MCTSMESDVQDNQQLNVYNATKHIFPLHVYK